MPHTEKKMYAEDMMKMKNCKNNNVPSILGHPNKMRESFYENELSKMVK